MKTYFDTFLQNQILVLTQNLKIAQESFDVNAIHDLRVAIKKIRALFLFVNEISGGEFKVKKRLKRLRKLFKAFGKLRDIQVQKELLNKYESNTNCSYQYFNLHLSDVQTKIQSSYSNEFLKFKTQHSGKIYTHFKKNIEPYNFNLISSSIYEQYKLRFKILKSLSHKISDYHNIHKFRIKLKEFIHIFIILFQNSEFKPETSVNINKMKNIADLLGSWHDKDIFLKSLSKFYTQNSKICENYSLFLGVVKEDIKQDLKVIENELISF